MESGDEMVIKILTGLFIILVFLKYPKLQKKVSRNSVGYGCYFSSFRSDKDYS